VTSEGKSPTEKWVEEKGADYAYAYDKGEKLFRALGGTGLPHAALIDPSGTVVWKGHPAGLTAKTIEEHLDGTLETPVFEWPDSAKNVRKALQKEQYASAIDVAEKLGDEGAEIASQLRRMVAARLAGLRKLYAEGDYLGVEVMGERCARAFAKLPEGEEAEALLKQLSSDEEAQRILDVQKDIDRTISGRIKKKDRERILEDLREITREYAGTAAARDAERAMAALRKA